MKKRLKIGLFLASDPSEAGGIQAFVHHVSRELTALEQNVVVFGPKTSRSHVYDFPSYIPVSKSLFLNFPSGFQPRINLPLFTIPDYKLDILHVHEPYVPFITGKFPFTCKATVKVAGFHTGWQSTGPWVNTVTTTLPYLRYLYSHYYNGMTYASNFVRKNWHVLFESTVPERIIGYGVTSPKQLFRKSDTGKVEVVFLARLVPRKGVLDFLQALNFLNTNLLQRMNITIIGDGSEREKAEMYVREHTNLWGVKFVGELIGEDRLSYLTSCHIFVAPYRDEGFGLTILEALSYGCVLTGYVNEVFETTLEGYPDVSLFVPAKDVKALAKSIEQLVLDETLRRRLFVWSHTQSQRFSWKAVAEQTLQFYRNLLESKDVFR